MLKPGHYPQWMREKFAGSGLIQKAQAAVLEKFASRMVKGFSPFCPECSHCVCGGGGCPGLRARDPRTRPLCWRDSKGRMVGAEPFGSGELRPYGPPMKGGVVSCERGAAA